MFQESISQQTSIGSGNGLAPNRRQAIIWTNDDPVHWRIYAALGEDGLNSLSCKLHLNQITSFKYSVKIFFMKNLYFGENIFVHFVS